MHKFRLFTPCILLLLQCSPKTPETSTPPNVLFIAIDDLNDWVEPLGGHPQAGTPHLNAFAEQAMTFTNAHASAPLCNPSRVSLLTGLDPRTTGIVTNNAFYPFREHLPDTETMIQYFKREGYYTAGFGKIFHKEDSRTEPWDEYKWCSGRPRPDPAPGHGIPFITDSVYRYFDWGPVPDSIGKWGEHKMANEAIRFLNRSHSSPFFLAMGFRLPHLAWYAPSEFFEAYDSTDIILPDFDHRDLEDIPGIIIERNRKNQIAHDTIMARGVWKEAVKAYLATIAYIDFELGNVLEQLKSSAYYNNTIVVIWSDHGFHLGEKNTWRKNTLWEESTRVPLFIRTPDMDRQGATTDFPVSLLDLYPTLVSLCGLPPRAGLDGQNISLLLDDPDARLERSHVTTTNTLGSAVRTKNWRYIRYNDGAEELYDHNNDPLERINLIEDPAHSAKVNELRALLSGQTQSKLN